jgi:hypothetical protein
LSVDFGPVRILAVDDHPLLCQGIAAIVSDQPDMMIVAEASNGREAIQTGCLIFRNEGLLQSSKAALSGLVEALLPSAGRTLTTN